MFCVGMHVIRICSLELSTRVLSARVHLDASAGVRSAEAPALDDALHRVQPALHFREGRPEGDAHVRVVPRPAVFRTPWWNLPLVAMQSIMSGDKLSDSHNI